MHPLDHAVWSALTTRQAAFATGGALALTFPTDVSPLAAAHDGSDEAIDALAALIPEGGDLSLLEPTPPEPPPSVRVAKYAAGLQMVARSFTADGRDAPIETLGDADAAEMLALATLTKPGPFRTRTHKLGRFLGIRDGGRLVAMAGERLHAEGFREISAVCTHPDYRGRGYGAALMRAVGARMLADGDTPFLHSYADNAPAIALYRSLGFEVRLEVIHAVWARA
ncbi:MAG: GNAT family N-acetyltransferase [Alphaproteobacteria bacterium]